jgi:hypothetical protein
MCTTTFLVDLILHVIEKYYVYFVLEISAGAKEWCQEWCLSRVAKAIE